MAETHSHPAPTPEQLEQEATNLLLKHGFRADGRRKSEGGSSIRTICVPMGGQPRKIYPPLGSR
jgi:hypothetical protein